MTSSTLPRRVREFPFPLGRDAYRYSANLEPAPRRRETEAGWWGDVIFNAGDAYEDFTAERARVLQRHPGMRVTAPHMRAAEWDALLYLMRRLAAEYPAFFTLREEERRCRWANRRLGLSGEFTAGEDGTLPGGPLEYIGRQVVEDLVLLDRREGRLYGDAGIVTFASGWSFPFTAGMSFAEIHGPVPRANADGVFARAEAFLLRMPPGAAYRRVNWAFQPLRVLDHSMDAAADWMPRAARFLTTATERDIAEQVYLRVELQHLIRLETSGAVLFLIDTRLLSLAGLATVPAWAARVLAVLDDLPDDVADYKGLRELRPLVTRCLRQLTG